MNLAEKLADTTADLVALKDNNAFLAHLFATAAGRWVRVVTVCGESLGIATRLEELETLAGGTLRVTWLEYPDSIYGAGYCVIIFFLEELHWSSVVLYNKGRWGAG